MYGHNATLYPMLAVGTFMTMFWTGIVVAHELGLGCVSLLILGLLSACTSTVGICELERRAGRGLSAEARRRVANPARRRSTKARRRLDRQTRSPVAPSAIVPGTAPVAPSGRW